MNPMHRSPAPWLCARPQSAGRGLRCGMRLHHDMPPDLRVAGTPPRIANHRRQKPLPMLSTLYNTLVTASAGAYALRQGVVGGHEPPLEPGHSPARQQSGCSSHTHITAGLPDLFRPRASSLIRPHFSRARGEEGRERRLTRGEGRKSGWWHIGLGRTGWLVWVGGSVHLVRKMHPGAF
jgi:hypothetical protein